MKRQSGSTIFRIAAYGLSAIVALSLSVLAALRIHSVEVREQAEQLQASVLKLEPGVTTLQDVRALVDKTKRPEGYAGFDGPCDLATCSVSIGPMAFTGFWHSRLSPLLGIFGVRPVNYGAILEVRDGILRKVDSSVFYLAGQKQIFSVSTVLVEHFSSEDLKSASALNNYPEYAICEGQILDDRSDQAGKFLRVATATAKTHKRIYLNLSCVTSRNGCSSPADLLQPQDARVSDFIPQATPPQCSSQKLAWSSIWPTGQYPQ